MGLDEALDLLDEARRALWYGATLTAGDARAAFVARIRCEEALGRVAEALDRHEAQEAAEMGDDDAGMESSRDEVQR